MKESGIVRSKPRPCAQHKEDPPHREYLVEITMGGPRDGKFVWVCELDILRVR